MAPLLPRRSALPSVTAAIFKRSAFHAIYRPLRSSVVAQTISRSQAFARPPPLALPALGRKSSSIAEKVPHDLFAEWIELTGAKSLDDLSHETAPIRAGDALVIIDMQQDFVPASSRNPDGGRFGVADGDNIVKPICSLIQAATEAGAVIVASRDYHPHDHW